ncbi:hypothetical protein RFI_20287, partial [Reticulomyxa filosa]
MIAEESKKEKRRDSSKKSQKRNTASSVSPGKGRYGKNATNEIREEAGANRSDNDSDESFDDDNGDDKDLEVPMPSSRASRALNERLAQIALNGGKYKTKESKKTWRPQKRLNQDANAGIAIKAPVVQGSRSTPGTPLFDGSGEDITLYVVVFFFWKKNGTKPKLSAVSNSEHLWNQQSRIFQYPASARAANQDETKKKHKNYYSNDMVNTDNKNAFPQIPHADQPFGQLFIPNTTSIDQKSSANEEEEKREPKDPFPAFLMRSISAKHSIYDNRPAVPF